MTNSNLTPKDSSQQGRTGNRREALLALERQESKLAQELEAYEQVLDDLCMLARDNLALLEELNARSPGTLQRAGVSMADLRLAARRGTEHIEGMISEAKHELKELRYEYDSVTSRPWEEDL